MKLKFLALLLSLTIAVAACETFLTPVNREYTKQTVAVTWQEVETETQLNAACGRSGEDRRILACAYIAPTSNTCTVFTYKNVALETLGHELLHCFTGRWHD